jgi:hypothetical protein
MQARMRVRERSQLAKNRGTSAWTSDSLLAAAPLSLPHLLQQVTLYCDWPLVLPCPPSAPSDITFWLPHYRTLLLPPTRCPAPCPSTSPPPSPSSLRTWKVNAELSTSLVNGSSSLFHACTAPAAPTRPACLLRVTRKLVSFIRVTAPNPSLLHSAPSCTLRAPSTWLSKNPRNPIAAPTPKCRTLRR